MTSQPSVAALPRPPRPGVLGSLVGQKAVMAVTGVILFLFVVGHLLGNLKIFEGPEAFNAYAEGLRTVGAPFFGRGWLLWIVRVVLIAAVLAHIWAAIGTSRASWRARPVSYRRLEPIETTYAARTMRRSEEHTSELQSQSNLVCRLLLEKKKKNEPSIQHPGDRLPPRFQTL